MLPRSFLPALLTLLTLAASAARAEDRVTVRGVYYREHSTRVVQPMVQVSKDLPNNVDIGAHFLLDAITSASVAAGAGVDELFTETRQEAGLVLGKTWGRTRIGGSFRASREPDYKSNTLGLSLVRGVWDNSGTVVVNLAYGADNFGALPMLTKNLDVWFAGGAYTQALTPTVIAQVAYDVAYLKGFLGNPYLTPAPYGHETPPRKRLRHALALRVGKYFPSTTFGLQLHYRLYYDQSPGEDPDPWGMLGHTIEGRVFKQVGRDVELRLSYRVHRQSAAAFWCNTDRMGGGNPDCYGLFPGYGGVASADPKFGRLATQMPELKLIWDLRVFESVPFLRFFAPGAWEISYAYYFQSSYYGERGRDQTMWDLFVWPKDEFGAHLLQTGYSLPF